MSTETIYNELMAKFKKDMQSAINDVHSELHGTMLPYLTDDTESNAGYRAAEMVRDILAGNFEFDGKYLKCRGIRVGVIDDFNYNSLVDALAAAAGDAAKDAKIARLEAQLNYYKEYCQPGKRI